MGSTIVFSIDNSKKMFIEQQITYTVYVTMDHKTSHKKHG